MSKQIIIIRHAEKPDTLTGQHLSNEGYVRAERLVSYLPQAFGTPDYVFAAEGSRRSMRPILTIMPLWKTLSDVPLDISVSDWHTEKVSFQALHLIRNNSGCSNILICWHHGHIPELLKELGVKHHDRPDEWPEDDYSSVYQLVFNHDDLTITKHQMPF